MYYNDYIFKMPFDPVRVRGNWGTVQVALEGEGGCFPYNILFTSLVRILVSYLIGFVYSKILKYGCVTQMSVYFSFFSFVH